MGQTSDTNQHGAGRPSLLTQEVLSAICDRLSEGEPLAQICRTEGMPAARTVREWQLKDPEISAAIARARDFGADAIAEECLSIADDATNDWMERVDEETQSSGWKLNGEHIQRSKLRIEARLKLLAKWHPKKYGDKVTLAGDKENPIEISDAKATLLRGIVPNPPGGGADQADQ